MAKKTTDNTAVTIEIKYFDGATPISQEDLERGDWIDLRANEDIECTDPRPNPTTKEIADLKSYFLRTCTSNDDDFKDKIINAVEDGMLGRFNYKLIKLGVAMKLPEGYEAHIVPRSSTFKNYGILMANSMGIIDNSYCGDNDEWMFPAFFTRKTVIHKGDRICQFRIEKKQPNIKFNVVDKLGNEDRGGFGSTGVE